MPKMILGIKHFSVHESANLLGKSDNAVRKDLSKDRLVGKKPGKSWLIPEAELNAFVTGTGIFRRRHKVQAEAFQLIRVFDSFLVKGDISQACYDQALKGLLRPSTGRTRIREGAFTLKSLFDDFLRKGDISQGHYDQAIERLSDFL